MARREREIWHVEEKEEGGLRILSDRERRVERAEATSNASMAYLVLALLFVVPGLFVVVLVCALFSFRPSPLVVLLCSVVVSGVLYFALRRRFGPRAQRIHAAVSLVLLGVAGLFMCVSSDVVKRGAAILLDEEGAHAGSGHMPRETVPERDTAPVVPGSDPDGTRRTAQRQATLASQGTGTAPSADESPESEPAPSTESAATGEVEWVALQRRWSRLFMEPTDCDDGAYNDFEAVNEMIWRPPEGAEIRLTVVTRSRQSPRDQGVEIRLVLLGEWEGSAGPQVFMTFGPTRQEACASAQAMTGFAGQRTDGLVLASLELLPQRNPEIANGAHGRAKRVLLQWNRETQSPRSVALWEGPTREVPQLFRVRPPP